MSRADALLARIESREATVALVGLGYVGLPLAVAFARAGFPVLGYDTDARRIGAYREGRSGVPDVRDEDLAPLVRSGRLLPTEDADLLAEADAISICVPTPLRKTREPDPSFVIAAADAVAARVRPGTLVVLESTTYPGTTREVLLPRLEARGLRVGEDVFLGFSPERIDPGNPEFGLRNTPKVLAGVTETCRRLVAALYGAVVDRVVPVSSVEAAETVKLLENTFRAVNIALANEMALVCDRLGLDVWEVVRAAATKPFGYLPFYPGPGLGGHCIPTDPHYLSWRLRALDFRVRFIDLADEVNRAMPAFVVDRVVRALNEDGKALRGSRILLLGLAYKRGVGDTRESPALDIARLLEERGAILAVHDPFVAEPAVEGRPLRAIASLAPETLASFDLAIVATDHPGVDYRLVVERVPIVVDTRNATAGLESLGRVRKL